MKIKKTQLIVFSALLVLFCLSSFAYGVTYDHEISTDRMTFSWNASPSKLDIKLTGKTIGWIGIGFNPKDKMKGANFILGYIKKGKIKIKDEFGHHVKNHKSDEQLGTTNDVTVIGGSVNDGQTTLEFSIPTDSGDVNDGKIDINGDTSVVIAHGPNKKSSRKKHLWRATIKVNLASGKHEIIEQVATPYKKNK